MALTSHERRIVAALAAAAIPPGARLTGGGEATVARLERFLARGGDVYGPPLRAGLAAFEAAAIALTGRPFSALAPAMQADFVARAHAADSARVRQLVRALLMPIKQAHFDDPEMFAAVGCAYGREVPRQAEARSRIPAGAVLDGAQRGPTAPLHLRCEVVVVGTGAGGAAAAFELARLGRAVVLLEAGAYHGRADFAGPPGEAFQRLYLGRGATFSLGNVGAPVWAGRGVGGTTTINSGTCYRAPDDVLRGWGRDFGLTGLTPEALAPLYDRVEAMLQVSPAEAAHLGGSARVVARGASALGLSHHPVRRNAPGCDGQGVCCFGCPTGAKRSTDVSYVPEALRRGATLVTGATVERVLVRAGRAAGVVGRLAGGGALSVEADAVVVAAGALSTPLLLRRSGLCQASGQLGRNLSIHPASKVMAVFDEVIDMGRGIPQSTAIDTYAAEGLMFEGASTPFDVTALSIPWVGPPLTALLEQYRHLATFGFMVKDESRGRVLPGPRGLPLIRYDLGPRDTQKMQRGIELLAELFLRAGARRVLPLVHGCQELTDEAGLARLRGLRLRPGDFDVAAFHPLGTCRRGSEPSRSCVDPEGEAHDVAGLFVADGSAVPSSLGVNPQMTIMALALRTAAVVDEGLRRRVGAAPAPETPLAHLTFNETMSGVWRRGGAPPDRPFTFHLDAASEPMARFLRRREVHVRGWLEAEGLATRRPVEGTMGLDFLLTRTIPYSLRFTGDDGAEYRFVGQKTIRLTEPFTSFTLLPGDVLDAAGERVGTAEIYFDLRRDVLPFFGSFRLQSQAPWPP